MSSATPSRYVPPKDFLLQKGSVAEALTHSSISKSGRELWLLRVPDNVSLKDLDGLEIKHPRAATNGIVAEIASTSSKPAYQIVTSDDNASVPAEFNGMAEMNILVPDDSEEDSADMLTLLPGRCTRLLSMVENIVIPSPIDYAHEISVRERPPRQQPDNMKLRFIPYGFYSAEEYAAMDQKSPAITAEVDVG
ncbi:hypothetical protein GGI02_001348, partial [Coemansia sp. RSA 2322]